MRRAVEFYSDLFGFTVVFQNGDPVIFTIPELESAETHLLPAPEYRGPYFKPAHLLVDDVDRLHRHCVVRGAPIVKAIANTDFDMRAFVIADPDGNRIDIGQPD